MSVWNPFAPKPRGADADVARVKVLVREVFGLTENTGITVSEIACRDSGCPGLETVILVLTPGQPSRAVKLSCPIAAVTREALVAERAVSLD